MRADVKPGTTFPDYQLLDHNGQPRRLSEIQGGDPMIIVLAREAYSAKDQRSSPTLAASSSATSKSRSTPTPCITRWSRTRSCAPPG
jgi:hypothetical protein